MSASTLTMYDGDMKSAIFGVACDKPLSINPVTGAVNNDDFLVNALLDEESRRHFYVMREVSVIKYYFNSKLLAKVRDIENGEEFITEDSKLFYKEINLSNDESVLKCYLLRKSTEIHEKSSFKAKSGLTEVFNKIWYYIFKF